MCTIVFAVKFRYILTYRKPYFEILYGKTPFLAPHRPPVGPPNFFCKWANLDPKKKNLKSLAGLEAEISMERTDGRTDGRQTEMRAYKRYHYRGLR